jgi:hypothetical protein
MIRSLPQDESKRSIQEFLRTRRVVIGVMYTRQVPRG